MNFYIEREVKLTSYCQVIDHYISLMPEAGVLFKVITAVQKKIDRFKQKKDKDDVQKH